MCVFDTSNVTELSITIKVNVEICKEAVKHKMALSDTKDENIEIKIYCSFHAVGS